MGHHVSAPAPRKVQAQVDLSSRPSYDASGAPENAKPAGGAALPPAPSAVQPDTQPPALMLPSPPPGADKTAQLKRDVRALAVDIPDRTYRNLDGLARAQAYLTGRLLENGAPHVDAQPVPSPFKSEPALRDATYYNLVTRLSDAAPERVKNPAKAIVITAHYDAPFAVGTRDVHKNEAHKSEAQAIGGTPLPSPGADDNASGVAALLQLQKDLVDRARRGEDFAYDVIFVATTLEEYGLGLRQDGSHSPIGQDGIQEPEGGLEGARVFFEKWAGTGRAPAITGVISLETIGRYSQDPGTQKFPAVDDAARKTLRAVARLPDLLTNPKINTAREFLDRLDDPGRAGDFVAGVTGPAVNCLGFAEDVVQAMREAPLPAGLTRVPTQVAALKHAGLRSDHAAAVNRPRRLWEAKIPGMMLTDTADYRGNPSDYHQASDTADKLDYNRVASVTAALAWAIPELMKK